jgi:hypothetical protein
LKMTSNKTELARNQNQLINHQVKIQLKRWRNRYCDRLRVRYMLMRF